MGTAAPRWTGRIRWMSEITRCPGGECPRRGRCYRFRAVAYGRYDAFGAPPFDPATGACAEFLDLDARRPTEAQVRDRAYARWQADPDGDAVAHWLAAEA